MTALAAGHKNDKYLGLRNNTFHNFSCHVY